MEGAEEPHAPGALALDLGKGLLEPEFTWSVESAGLAFAKGLLASHRALEPEPDGADSRPRPPPLEQARKQVDGADRADRSTCGSGTISSHSESEPQPEPSLTRGRRPRDAQSGAASESGSTPSTPMWPIRGAAKRGASPALDRARARHEAAVGQLQNLKSLVTDNAHLRAQVENLQAPAEKRNRELEERVAQLEAANKALLAKEASWKEHSDEALHAAKQLESTIHSLLERNSELLRQRVELQGQLQEQRHRGKAVRVTLGAVRHSVNRGSPMGTELPPADPASPTGLSGMSRSSSKDSLGRSASPLRETKFGGA